MEKFKQIIKKPITWILVVAVLLVGAVSVWLIAGNNPSNTDDSIQTTAEVLNPNTPVIKEKLSWDAVNSYPIKTGSMTTDELRQLCADFFRFTKTAKWAPKQTFTYYTNADKKDTVTMKENAIYGGLPYISKGSGNIYRLLENMDSAGAVDVSKLIKVPDFESPVEKVLMECFGNQCSIGAYWGWGRVVNSPVHWWTQYMVPDNGVIMLGEYPGFDFSTLKMWQNKNDHPMGHDTVDVMNQVGQEQMYRNYALLKLADGLVYYTTAGHVIMCTGTPVVYDTDGNKITDLTVENLRNVKIDGARSYILITDQTGTWMEGISPARDKYKYEANVDSRKDFATLFKNNYVPFTFEEFLDPTTVEETQCAFTVTKKEVTKDELFAGEVSCNYGISDVYGIFKDAKGREVYRHIVRADVGGQGEIDFAEDGIYVFKQGELKPGTYTVEISVQLSTGERPTIYTGKVTV